METSAEVQQQEVVPVTDPFSQDVRDITDDDSYVNRFARLDGREPPVYVGFNWWAFVFGPLWFVYRKLYISALVVWLLGFVVPFIALVIIAIVDQTFSESMVTPASYLVLFGVLRPVVGAVANGLYLRKVRNIIASADSVSLVGSQRSDFLKKRGGMNEGAAIAVMIISLVISFASRALNMV